MDHYDRTFLFMLVCMADMYANKCTRQYEKFEYYQRNGIDWRWIDCQAAWEILHETGHYWQIRDAWKRGELLHQ